MSTPDFSALPDPNTVQFTVWANVASEQLASFDAPIPPQDDKTWADWAAQLCGSEVSGATLPEPYGFTDWRSWACAVMGT